MNGWVGQITDVVCSYVSLHFHVDKIMGGSGGRQGLSLYMSMWICQRVEEIRKWICVLATFLRTAYKAFSPTILAKLLTYPPLDNLTSPIGDILPLFFLYVNHDLT